MEFIVLRYAQIIFLAEFCNLTFFQADSNENVLEKSALSSEGNWYRICNGISIIDWNSQESGKFRNENTLIAKKDTFSENTISILEILRISIFWWESKFL